MGQGGKQHVFGKHFSAGQAIEQRGFARIGISHQGNKRIRHPFAGLTMQSPGPFHLIEIFFQARDPFVDHTPVELDLAFTRTTHETKAATLALKMGP